MKTLKMNKQQFAKYIMNISEYLTDYWYDMFYDIPKFRDLEKTGKESTFYICFRNTGFDTVFCVDGLELPETNPYIRENEVVILCKFTPAFQSQYRDESRDLYELSLVKDRHNKVTEQFN